VSAGNLSVEARRRYAFIEKLLTDTIPPPARVVELGAAPGDQISRLAGLGYQCTSVDIGVSSDQWGAGDIGRMTSLLAAAGVEDVTWDLEKTPYPLTDGAFDAVVMTEVYEHLREYPYRALEEVRRVLRPGGRLYFTTPNQAYVMNRLRLLAGRNVQTPLRDWIEGLPFARHAREYTFSELDELMARAGLVVRYRSSRHFHLSSGRTTATAKAMKAGLSLCARLRPTLGPSIIVVAERGS
jgi:SAM-dependent methyltransferase